MANINIGNTTRSKPMSNIVAWLVKVIRNQLQTDNFVTHSIVTPWYTNFFVDTKPLQWLGIHLSCQLYRLVDIIPMYLKLHTSLLWQYRIGLFATKLPSTVFTFPTSALCRRLSCFVTDCPCGASVHRKTTCLSLVYSIMFCLFDFSNIHAVSYYIDYIWFKYVHVYVRVVCVCVCE